MLRIIYILFFVIPMRKRVRNRIRKTEHEQIIKWQKKDNLNNKNSHLYYYLFAFINSNNS